MRIQIGIRKYTFICGIFCISTAIISEFSFAFSFLASILLNIFSGCIIACLTAHITIVRDRISYLEYMVIECRKIHNTYCYFYECFEYLFVEYADRLGTSKERTNIFKDLCREIIQLCSSNMLQFDSIKDLIAYNDQDSYLVYGKEFSKNHDHLCIVINKIIKQQREIRECVRMALYEEGYRLPKDMPHYGHDLASCLDVYLKVLGKYAKRKE